MSILVASDIAHLSNPRSTAIMGASIALIFGLLYTISDVNAAFAGEMSLMELFIVIILGSCLFGIFYGLVGYIAGRLLKGYKESKGFFF
jgi:ABC-type multidrug transport system permease subunit